MAELDTSFYNQQPPANLLTGLGSTIGVANGIAQNRILGTESNMLSSQYGSNQAVGRDFQAAAGDPVKLNNLLSGDPAAAYGAPAAFQAAGTLQSTNLANAATTAVNSQAYRSNIAATLNALPAPNATAKGARDAISTLVSEGSIPATLGAQLSTEVPNSDKAVPGWISQRFGAALTPAQQARPVNSGYNPKTLEPQTATLAGYLKTADQSGGSVAASPPPGASDAAATNRAEFVQDQKNAYPILQNAIPLQNALPLISKLNHFNFGPGSQELMQVKAGLQFAGVIPQDSSAADTTSIRQQVNKYLHQYSSGAVGAARSDAGLSQALSSNPNLDLTQDANLSLIKSQLGRDFMTAAMPSTYSSDSGTYLSYKSKYAQQNDPRAFIWGTYTPQERRQIIDGMGGENSAAYQKFKQSYGNAVKAGFITTPQAAQPAQGAPNGQ